MKITENIIRSGIVRTIKGSLGNDYDYYTDDMPQNFKRGSFTIEKLLSTDIKGMQMMTKKNQRLVDYIISYYPKDEFSTTWREECNDIQDELYNSLDYVYVKDLDGKDGYIQVLSKNGEVIDKILRFYITVSVRTARIAEKNKIKELEIVEKIKGGI